MTEPSPATVLAQATEELRLALDARQQARLVAYVELLGRWNRSYNLTAIREPMAMMTQHVVDSLAIVTPLRARLSHRANAPRRARVLDVGSGAGLPGVVVAVAAPEIDVVCIDSVGKKAAFITQAQATLGQGNLIARRGRVQDFAAPAFDIIVSRAFSSLIDLVEATEHLLVEGGSWLAMKGAPADDELAAIGTRVRFHVEPLCVPALSAARCIVWMHSLHISEHTLTSESARR